MENIQLENFKPQKDAVIIVKMPIDKNGEMIYDVESMSNIFKSCQEVFKDNSILCLMDNIKLENCTYAELESLRNEITKVMNKRLPSRVSLATEFARIMEEDD